jgi:hypothetical protein
VARSGASAGRPSSSGASAGGGEDDVTGRQARAVGQVDGGQPAGRRMQRHHALAGA